MAFTSHSLRVLAPVAERYTGGPVLWSYTTDDAWSALLEPGYFAPNTSNLRIGDPIIVNAESGGQTQIGVLAVLAKMDGGPVVGELVAPITFDTMVESLR